MELWTAFTVGLVGSLHCIGMCGPIALALPYQGRNKVMAAANVLLYNFGRIFTYSLLGVVIGLFGKGLFLAGFQSYVSIGLGVLLLLVALFSINIESRILSISLFQRFNFWVKNSLARLLKKNNLRSLFLIGILNGFLPCGLVYMAIVGAITTGGITHSIAYMALFGLGTIPLMLSTSVLGQFISLKWRMRAKKILPVFLFFFALLFIFRGLNFDLPIDLRFWENAQNPPICQ